MRLIYPGTVILFALGAAACGDPAPNGVIVELAPDTISSIDGTTTVTMMVVDDRTPVDGQPVQITVSYTDRNGTDHAIDPIEGTTDARGAFEGTLAGLDWEGTGMVTATVLDAAGAPLVFEDLPVDGAATFAVFDRTPPTVEILPPTTDLHIGAGLPLEVRVHVTDEIGVSQVILEAAGELNTTRTTWVASGSTDGDVTFRLEVPDGAIPGPTITLYALAGDLSGNQAAAVPVVLIVDPATNIATPPGLAGEILAEGSDTFLADPRALAVSPMDGLIYVADNSGGNACQGGCIRQVDPATGAVSANAVVLASGTAEGIAFDATGDNLYYSDRQDRIARLTWNGNTYANGTVCNNVGSQFPAQPYHLVHDATLGVLVVDDETGRVLRLTACTGGDATELSSNSFDRPRGIALGSGGEIYVSDNNDDVIDVVDRTTGARTRFEDHNLDRPYGLDWLAGGTSAYADSLMIADSGDRIVVSTQGAGPHPTAYLRNEPIDVAVDGLTMYVLTRPSAGDSGRIFAVTGF
jgi:hypothetical protein